MISNQIRKRLLLEEQERDRKVKRKRERGKTGKKVKFLVDLSIIDICSHFF